MLSVENVGIDFGSDVLFKEVSFRVTKRNRIGLAGKNGAGKSTLLKVLSKEQAPTSGQVVIEGNNTIGFLRQDLEFEDDTNLFEETKKSFSEIIEIDFQIHDISRQLETRTDYESDEYTNLIEDLNHYTEKLTILGEGDMEGEIEKILLGLGFSKEDYKKPTSEFSGGWRMRIELAKLLLQKHDILLLDEPTNHLDIDSILWLETFLLDYEGAIILVSHDKMFLDKLCNRTIEIANKKIQDYKANYSNYLISRQERREKLAQAIKNQDKQIKHTEELINKFKAKASKASTAKSMMKKLDRVERLEQEEEDITKLNIRFIESNRPGKIVVKIEGGRLAFGDKTILNDINIEIERGEKVAFVGQNGQGKTTLAKAIVGEKDLASGKLNLGHNVELGYFAQNQSEVMNGENTLLVEAENSANEHTFKLVRDMLGSFLFSGDEVEKRVKVLSGGERNRLALCKLLLQPFNVLVMDEPTNHLDIQSKEILKRAMSKFEGTVILVSHDREFLDGLVDKVFEFREGRIKEHIGGIEEYLEGRKVAGFREIEKVTQEKKPQTVVEDKQYKENKDAKKIESQIEKTEKDIERLEKEVSVLEKKFVQHNPSTEELEKYEKIKNSIKTKMSDWEKLQTQLN